MSIARGIGRQSDLNGRILRGRGRSRPQRVGRRKWAEIFTGSASRDNSRSGGREDAHMAAPLENPALRNPIPDPITPPRLNCGGASRECQYNNPAHMRSETKHDLLSLLATELERPRPLPAQVVKHLSGVHGVEREQVGAFLTQELPKLEDYEIDLALAPVFTPSLDEQAVFAELLGAESAAAAEWPALVRALVERPARATLVTEDGQPHVILLRDVSIERFVHRLRLQGRIPPALLALIQQRIAAAQQPLFKAIARRAIWESEPREQILRRFIEASTSTGAERTNDAIQLLRLMETYEPADLADLRSRIPHWEQVLRHEISTGSGPKPFFNERVQDLHGGGRDQRGRANTSSQQRELEFLHRLKQILAE